MARKRRKHREQVFSRRSLPGSAPGTLIVDPEAPRTKIHVIAYGAENMAESDVTDAASVRGFLESWPVVWVRVSGLGDLAAITQLGEIFGLHRLALEDVINVHQRSKVEQYRDYSYIVVRAVNDADGISSEQVSIFLGKSYVISFHESDPGCFDPVAQRIREGKGLLRGSGPSHLAYSLIDACIDRFFPVVERYGDQLETLEDAIIAQPGASMVDRIHETKGRLMTLRRISWPMRDAMMVLYRDPILWVNDEERIYLRDCYDHMVQINDLLESYRDISAGLMEVYLSSLGNRTNEIMKVLTILSAVFIPLTLISGVYGMNFEGAVPAFDWRGGFFFALGLMVAVAVAMLLYFRRKGWWGGEGASKGNR
ncbi:MAG: magnesium/cobalt transporter CorA [Acidobacteriota bacterium]|jgi:magnesium transporter|nr:magnesium/cobalt transporter CorA [Acidobacteriota bacterium]